MLSVLFVEDDTTIAMGVEYSLKQDGFQVSLAYRLEEARDLLKRQPFDLVLLDLGLPDGSGYELCKEIRAAGDTPIIILSARDEEASIVLGLDLGADDYLTKPFRLRELISRMKAAVRRRASVEASDRTLTCGDVTVVAQQAKVYKNGREVVLAALLKLARLDAGTAVFKSEPVNVRRLIERALEPLQIPLEIKNQRLEVHGDDGASFIGDLNWSAEALINVVKNCVGIGLALAKAIFNAQGGDISVRSQPGVGTSFEIRVFRGVV